MSKPPRYVVLVWFYDHWGVTYTTDDFDDAQRVSDLAATKVRSLVVDTNG